MTDGNPRPQQEPTPPASTQWSDEAEAASGNDDEGLAPPFVPGGAAEPATEPAVPEPAAAGPGTVEPTAPEPAGSESAPSEPSEPEEGPLPFEAGRDEEEEDGAMAQEAGDDFPFEAFDIEGADEGVEDEAGPDDSTMAVEPVEPVGPAEPSPRDVGAGTTPTTDEETPSDVREPSETGDAAEQTVAAELADRLEDMAARLRDRGVEAAEAQMSAPDRFTALLAGLLAGYLSGRE